MYFTNKKSWNHGRKGKYHKYINVATFQDLIDSSDKHIRHKKSNNESVKRYRAKKREATKKAEKLKYLEQFPDLIIMILLSVLNWQKLAK